MSNKLAIKIRVEIDQIDELFAVYSDLLEKTRRELSPAVTEQLDSYLTFRHFYRHSYTYLLNWVKLEPLVASLEIVWSQAKTELNIFLDRLRAT